MTRAGPDSAALSTSAGALSEERAWGLPIAATSFLESVLVGGFDCSSQKLADGRRTDLLASTRHDELAAEDYVRLRNVGMTVCRDGIPWPFVERQPGRFDFSRFTSMVHAARRHGIDVIWDLLPFGWPDDVAPFDPSFPARFGRYASAFARWLSMETDRAVMLVPINEMSVLASAGGDLRSLNPFESARGVELKAQLVRATIEAIEAVRLVIPGARFVQSEPVIHVVPVNEDGDTKARAELDNLLQHQAWEMLSGRVWPSLGGHPRYLDIVGVSFSADSQRMSDGRPIGPTDAGYRPFAAVLSELAQRYARPMMVSATGSRGPDRAPWLRYVTGQCVAALRQGCELHGVTLYPVVGRSRQCEAGLWGHANELGHRELEPALLHELVRARPRLEAARDAMLRARAGLHRLE